MVNIEERFKKPEVEKPAPQVNKIVIPTFEKQADSEEEVPFWLFDNWAELIIIIFWWEKWDFCSDSHKYWWCYLMIQKQACAVIPIEDIIHYLSSKLCPW